VRKPRSPWYPLDRRLDGPHCWSGNGGKEKNSQPLPRLKPPIIQHYTIWAILAPCRGWDYKLILTQIIDLFLDKASQFQTIAMFVIFDIQKILIHNFVGMFMAFVQTKFHMLSNIWNFHSWLIGSISSREFKGMSMGWPLVAWYMKLNKKPASWFHN